MAVDTTLQGAYAAAHAVTAVAAAGLGYWVVTRTGMRARRRFGLFIGATAAWSGCAAVNVLAGRDALLFASWALCAGLAGLSAFALVLFVTTYTGRDPRSNRVVYAAAVVGAVGALGGLTAPLHDLYWASAAVLESPFPHVDVTPGPLNFLMLGYAPACIVASYYYFFELYLKSRRRPSAALLVIVGGLVVGLVPFVFSRLGLLPVPTYDHTVFGVLPVAAGFGYATLRMDLADVTPVARDEAVAQLRDPYLAVDDDGLLVDFNGAAADLLAVDDADIGDPIGAVAPSVAAAVSGTVADGGNAETDLVLAADGTEREFDVTVSPIPGPRDEQRGDQVLLRDITLLKQRERQLRERERELDRMRQVQSRVLRHNIRNDLNVVRMYNELLAETLDGEVAEMAERAVAKTEQLAAVSEKARAAERLVEGPQSPEPIDLAAVARTLVARFRADHPGVTFSLTAPEHCRIETVQSVEVAVRNLIENAAEHNDATDPTVAVTVAERDGAVEIAVDDNGPGIPEAELSVFDRGGETPLEHGSGMGLWVVEWVAEKADATVHYDVDGAGTTVTLHIPSDDQGADG